MNIFKAPSALAVMAGLLLSFSPIANASPIQEIKMDYNLLEQKLRVKIDFIVRDRQKDFIRKVMIYKNNQQVVEVNYVFQKENGEFSQSYDIEAEAYDELTLKAYMSRGGTKTASIIIPRLEEKKEDMKETNNIPVVEETDATPEVQNVDDMQEQTP